MTEPTNITREELLELAAADALGALAEVDAARFERAFASAAPSLQAEVRAAQERLATDPLFLSSEVPAPSLRLRVLARMASAIEEEASAVKPIATIGPAAGGGRPRSRPEPAPDKRDAIIRELIERSSRESRPTQHGWRAAALFLFAALMVALYFNAEQRRISDRLIDVVDRQQTDRAAREVARLAVGFNVAGARPLVVRDRAGNAAPHIHAFLDADAKRVFVYGMGVMDPAKAVFVRSATSDVPVTLSASALVDRGFALVFAMPESSEVLQLEIGDSIYTIEV